MRGKKTRDEKRSVLVREEEVEAKSSFNGPDDGRLDDAAVTLRCSAIDLM